MSKARFIQQQGFADAAPSSCGVRYSALMLQPRLITAIVAVGIVTQSAALFFTMAVLLTWNALVPRWNPFDALYRIVIARPRGLPPLGPAPPPRRFAQGLAAAFMLAIGFSIVRGYWVPAVVLEAFLMAAVLALVAGRFCLGSYLYHVMRGNAAFANRTAPWARSGEGARSADEEHHDRPT